MTKDIYTLPYTIYTLPGVSIPSQAALPARTLSTRLMDKSGRRGADETCVSLHTRGGSAAVSQPAGETAHCLERDGYRIAQGDQLGAL